MQKLAYLALAGVLLLFSWWGASVIFCRHVVDELQHQLPAGTSLDDAESVLKDRGMDYQYGMGQRNRAAFRGQLATYPNLGPLGFLHFVPIVLIGFDRNGRLSSIELFEGAWFTPP
jgi:hypothetical protein